MDSVGVEAAEVTQGVLHSASSKSGLGLGPHSIAGVGDKGSGPRGGGAAGSGNFLEEVNSRAVAALTKVP